MGGILGTLPIEAVGVPKSSAGVSEGAGANAVHSLIPNGGPRIADEVPRALKLINSGDQAGENFNDDIFGFDRIAENTMGQVKQRPLDVPDQASKIPNMR
jgi:hypothetical protein